MNDTPRPTITARQINHSEYGTMYMADGPDNHLSLLLRGTPEAAIKDGTEYFLESREYVGGRWRIKRYFGADLDSGECTSGGRKLDYNEL